MSVTMNIETCSPHYMEFTHSLQVASSESDRKVRPTATAKMATLCVEGGDRNAFFGHSAVSVHPWWLLQGSGIKTNGLHLRNHLNCSPSRTTFRFEGYLLSHPKPTQFPVSCFEQQRCHSFFLRSCELNTSAVSHFLGRETRWAVRSPRPLDDP